MQTRMTCETCGGEVQLSENKLVGTCRFCRNTYHFKNEKSEALILALNRARGHRLACDFHEAIKEYKLLIDDNPSDAEAHFGMLLSIYGIEFVEDKRTAKYIPTCHRFVDEDVLKNAHYLAAIENAPEEQRQKYIAIGEEIARLQQGIKRKLELEEPYDVFISFKATDESGVPTEDSVIARNIYDELTKRGIRTFFSEVTLAGRIGEEYEPIIHRALYSCKFFILVATREEYINAPWVKNEWTRLEDRIKAEGLSGASAAVFKGISPYALPNSFRNQGVDIEKHPFDYSVMIADSIENKLRAERMINAPREDIGASGEKKLTLSNTAKMIIPVALILVIAAIVAAVIIIRGASGGPSEPPSADVGNDELGNYETMGEYVTAKKLTSFEIPEGTTAISECEFLNCDKLETITIPASVKRIEERAFKGCISLREVIIPEGVLFIGASAFSGCKNITYVSIPASIEIIEGDAFYQCGGIKKAKILDLERWCAISFGSEYANPIAYANEVYVGEELLTELVIPGTVKEIGDYAFASVESLKSVRIPGSVEKIGISAFADCKSIETVKFDIPSAWWVNEQALDPSLISDESGIVYYLISGYREYAWIRK
ncbi:MAG: leucine-rich repeat protein [Clostridia bacterium]|nr:leucine-rich repeat protein [Clostridia bacterium]